MSRTSPFVVMKGSSLLLVAMVLLSCAKKTHTTTPTVTFTTIPPGSAGGPDKLETIEGHVTNARPGQNIVLYVKSEDLWWVQPFTDRPFSKIQSDSSWKGQTHDGWNFAALLVDRGYTPSDTIKTLPPIGGGVAAVATTPGTGPPPPPLPLQKKIHFSGYDWTVRREASFRGGTGNTFESDNAWTDETGALHLRIAENHHVVSKSQSKWSCAEVELDHSLGYGTYVFTIRDTGQLDPSTVLDLFTWDDQGTEQSRRELDVEISRWGVPKGSNTQYVVQPYYIPTNTYRLIMPAALITHSFRWEPGQVAFSSSLGSDESAKAHVVDKHVFGIGVPTAGGDTVHISLYVFGSGFLPLQKENEVVIEKFEFLP